MDYTTREFSFEWKPFFTTFFADFLHVAKKQDPKNPYASVLKRTERAEREWKATKPREYWKWAHDYGSLEEGLFERAYLDRSRREHERLGLRFLLGVKDLEAIRVEVQRMRKVRNGAMWQRLDEKSQQLTMK
jgi:hypothetical protein